MRIKMQIDGDEAVLCVGVDRDQLVHVLVRDNISGEQVGVALTKQEFDAVRDFIFSAQYLVQCEAAASVAADDDEFTEEDE